MKMTRARLNALKASVVERKEKSSDMDILVSAFKKLPFGQFKKLMSEELLAVLAKYGYTE